MPDARLSTALERLDALARPDKWFLSTGTGLVWAPPFPEHLDRPGFWDAAHLVQHRIAPLFTVAVLDPELRELPLRVAGWHWRPDRLRVVWEAVPPGAGPAERWRTATSRGLRLIEERYALPHGRLCSAWRREGEGASSSNREGWLVALTAQPGPDTDAFALLERGLQWRRSLEDAKGGRLTVAMTLRADGTAQAAATQVGATRSQGVRPHPEWELTPFRESGTTWPGLRLEGLDDGGWVYAAVGTALPAVDGEARFEMEIAPSALPHSDAVGDASAPLPRRRGAIPGVQAATDTWGRVLESFPRFSCSDPHLTRAYDYRIYGLHLNRLQGGFQHIRHPAIAEGIEYFHVPITYSAQCHMWEMRWCQDPEVARGSLLNFLDAQKADGSFHGRLYADHVEGTDFYHANWGDAVLAVEALHPDRSFAQQAYEGLCRYARWLDEERDPEGSGLFTVVNHYETGQEYMSRYVVVDPDSDRNEWEPRLRLKGVDVTVYAHQLRRALAVLAQRLGRSSEADHHALRAHTIGEALLTRMWDGRGGIFTDVDGGTGRQTGTRSAVGFYPLLTDLLSDARRGQLLATLSDPDAFWTPYPVPASAVDDPYFDAEGLWKGKRHNCPWNGRVWPMTNSHVIEGLLRQWQHGCARAGELGAALLARTVHMLFHDDALERPNTFEHYNPFTGAACRFRGIDDYQHSWLLDPLVRGIAGFEPTDNGFVVHPLPAGPDWVRLEGLGLRGRRIDIEIEGTHVAVHVDGWSHEGTRGTALEVTL